PQAGFQAGRLALVGDKLAMGLLGGPQLADNTAHFDALGDNAGVAVQIVQLLTGPEQGHVLGLTVDVDQPLAELLQDGQGYAATVDACAAAATAAGYLAADDQGAILRLESVLVQCGLDLVSQVVGDGEDALDDGPLRAAADHFRPETIAEQGADGVDQDGLAGAGFAGDDVETWLPVDLEMVDDREIANRELAQHSAVIMPAGVQRLRNSTFPAGPLIGDSVTSVRRHGCVRDHASRSCTTCCRTAASRTTPPLPTWPRPASNWGLMSATICSVTSLNTGGRASRREMNETSTTARSIGSGSSIRWRTFVRSMTTTRGSPRSL